MRKFAFREFFYSILPKPAALGSPGARKVPIKRLLVLCNGSNPTFTYYLEERLNRDKFPFDVRYLQDPISGTDPEGVFVIICRYIGPRQLLWLLRNRRRLAGVSLLVDDDIAATVAGKGGTFWYKIYLCALGIAPLPLLNRILSDVWVSTPQLAEAIAPGAVRAPIVLPPLPPAYTFTESPSYRDTNKIMMAFHATGNHDSEHEFLIPIVQDAMSCCPKLHFEVTTSNSKVERAWRMAGLPACRFRLRPLRKWIEYVDETRRQSIDILLVPLLESAVNNARSDTKRFDSARMGAAALFSCGHVYELSASPGEMLVENEHRAWVKNILHLAGSEQVRHAVKNATRNAIETSLDRAISLLPLGEDQADDNND